MTDFYTYIHAKPNGGDPFYVGKGCGGRSHMLTQRSQYHKRMIKKYGVEIFVFPCESEEQALADEIQQIAQLRAEGYELVNRTDGGDGTSGYRHTPEAKAVMAKAAIGRPSGYKGRTQSEESRARSAKAAREQAANTPPEIRAARASAASKAHWDRVPKEKRAMPAEVRAKLSAANKGKPAWNKGISPSDESRAKMRESGKKKVMTAEHKAKIVAAQRTPEMRARQAAAKMGRTPWNKGRKNVTAPDQKKMVSECTESSCNQSTFKE